MPDGHVSHETGLDVDIWFNSAPKPALAPVAREEVSLPSMVLANGKDIDPAEFGQKQVELLRLAAIDPRVDRIFVNPAIKRALCRGYAVAMVGNRSWLHHIRPWGYERHFHVRLKCPAGSLLCVSQPPVPPGMVATRRSPGGSSRVRLRLPRQVPSASCLQLVIGLSLLDHVVDG